MPIRLECSVDGATWRSVTENDEWLPNTGEYVWTLPLDLPPELHLRVIARDKAGNIGESRSQSKYPIDLTVPEGRISGFVERLPEPREYCPSTQFKTIYVPIFANKVGQTPPFRGIELELTRATIIEINQTTPMRVVSDRDAADTELLGTVVLLNKSLLNRDQRNEVHEGETVLGVKLVWRDLRTLEVLSDERKPVVFTGRSLPEVGESSVGAQQRVCSRLARKVVYAMESAVSETLTAFNYPEEQRLVPVHKPGVPAMNKIEDPELLPMPRVAMVGESNPRKTQVAEVTQAVPEPPLSILVQKSRNIRLPLYLGEENRASLSAIELYVKTAKTGWVLAQVGKPTQENFDYRTDNDGDFRFLFVGVTKTGKRFPSNIELHPGHQHIVVKTTQPVISVEIFTAPNRDIWLVCKIIDELPDINSIKLEYLTDQNTWQALDLVHADSPGVFAIPNMSVLEGKVRATAQDKAGNVTKRIIDLGNPKNPFITVGRDKPPISRAANIPAANDSSRQKKAENMTGVIEGREEESPEQLPLPHEATPEILPMPREIELGPTPTEVPIGDAGFKRDRVPGHTPAVAREWPREGCVLV